MHIECALKRIRCEKALISISVFVKGVATIERSARGRLLWVCISETKRESTTNF